MVEWTGDIYYSELKINNKLIGILSSYDDCGEDFGWMFTWNYGIMKYEFETEYFSVSSEMMIWTEFNNVQKRVLARVKDVIGYEYLELKHLYDAICLKEKHMCKNQ